MNDVTSPTRTLPLLTGVAKATMTFSVIPPPNTQEILIVVLVIVVTCSD